MDNFLFKGVLAMAQEDKPNFKIRFRLPSGEEFEAEGPKEFIEEQRAYFLRLTGKKPLSQPSSSPIQTPAPARPAPAPRAPYAYPTVTAHTGGMVGGSSGYQPSIKPLQAPKTPQNTPEAAPISEIWEKLFKTEDGALVLRRKSRLLTPQTAALVLIAAARMLRKENEYSALHLSKSLRKSGYGEGRLDRLLLPEMRAGSVESAGSKRGRAYKLSSEGLARAIVLAEKIAEDL